MIETRTDILIVGGGVGGCAAALSATSLGHRVVLTEETAWLGGQLTSQGVPPDEHEWIESSGCTARYRRFRDGVRALYRDHYPLTDAAREDPRLNPGGGFVSGLCCEPRVSLAVLEAMLLPAISAGRLEVRRRARPVSAETDGDRVTAVVVESLETGERTRIEAAYVLDATELGDLLPLTGCEFVTGAEAQSETDEPHAKPVAETDNVQAFTWCFAMGWDPAGEHVIERPAQYDRWRDYVPSLTPAWSGRLLDWSFTAPITLQPRRVRLLPEEPESHGDVAMFAYRQIVRRDRFAAGWPGEDVTLVNWPQNDYLEGNLIGATPEQQAAYLDGSRQVSLSLLYWLQTEAPRPDGGQGYPGLRPRGDLLGTTDGLVLAPYIRESRRIRAEFTVTENHVGQAARGDVQGAEPFADSVGVGCYRIDLHPSTGGDNYVDVGCWPFQIPLGALLPVRLANLLPACKNLGVTHITNGCYRLHPVEWNIGEAAGLLAAFCLANGEPPRAVRERSDLLGDFQALLVRQGVELAWGAVHVV